MVILDIQWMWIYKYMYHILYIYMVSKKYRVSGWWLNQPSHEFEASRKPMSCLGSNGVPKRAIGCYRLALGFLLGISFLIATLKFRQNPEKTQNKTSRKYWTVRFHFIPWVCWFGKWTAKSKFGVLAFWTKGIRTNPPKNKNNKSSVWFDCFFGSSELQNKNNLIVFLY